MTIIITDRTGTDVRTYDEETKYFTHLFGCDINFRVLDPPWD